MNITEAHTALVDAIAHRTDLVDHAESLEPGSRLARLAWIRVEESDTDVRFASQDLEFAVRRSMSGKPEHTIQTAVHAA